MNQIGSALFRIPGSGTKDASMTRQAAQGSRRARLFAHILGLGGANLVAATLTMWLLQAAFHMKVQGGWAIFALGILCLGIALLTRGARLIASSARPDAGLQQALRNPGA